MNNFITTLLAFINNPDIKDTNYRIALCLLNHCLDFNQMTIQKIAEESYVSISTVNRFIGQYGFKKYSVFRQRYLSHLQIRHSQMLKRLEAKKAYKPVFRALMKDYGLINDELINLCCQFIHESHQIILIGSDEMCYATLRFQGDFYMMGKKVIKISLFEEEHIIFDDSDFVLFFSMNGNLLDYKASLLPKFLTCSAKVFFITKTVIPDAKYVLHIPNHVDEVIENMALDYYMQEILYTYMEKYYVNR